MFRWHEGALADRTGNPLNDPAAVPVGSPAASEAHWAKTLKDGLEPLLLPGRRRRNPDGADQG